MDSIFDTFVPSYFEIGDYEIIILQNPEGDLITLRVEVYESRG